MTTTIIKFFAAIFITILFSAFPSGISAQVCTPAPVGLVSWWSGDGNALDSRSRKNGTLTGTSFVAGQSGQAIRFAAPSPTDLFSADGSGSLNITGEQVTIEGWVKLENNSVHPAQSFTGFIGKHGFPNDQNYLLFFESGALAGGGNLPPNQWQFSYALANSSGQRVGNQNSNVIVTAGAFNHLAMTYNGSQPGASNVKLYVNGVLQATNIIPIQQITGSLKSSPNEPFAMQTWSVGPGIPFETDEVSVYDRALSADEIAAIHNAGTAGKCKPTATVAPSGLIGWWSGDGNANDISGNALNGTFVGPGKYAFGKVGQAIEIDGSQHIEIPDNNLLDLNNNFSIEMWAMPKQNGDPDYRSFFLGKGDFNFVNTQSFGIILTPTNAISGRIGLGTSIHGVDSAEPVPLNEYSHIVFTKNGTTLNLFINGELSATGTVPAGDLLNTSQPLIIGGAFINAFGVVRTQSVIDETSIYNRALNPAEVQSIYNAGIAGKLKNTVTSPRSGQVGFWRGDGNALDSSGFGNNGILTGTSFVTGQTGNALRLASATDKLSASGSGSLDIKGDQVTIEGWLRLDNNNVHPAQAFTAFIGKNGFPDDQNFLLVFESGSLASGGNLPANQWLVQYILTNSSDQRVHNQSTNVVIPAGIYNHIAMTYNGSQPSSGNVKLYVNGVLQATTIFPLQQITGNLKSSPSQPVTIQTGGSGSPFEADEIAVYNRELTATEIQSIYNEGALAKGKAYLNNAEDGQRSRKVNSTPLGESFGPVISNLGDVAVTFDSVTSGGIIQQIPLDLSLLPALPSGTSIGLTYDIATSAVFSGNPTVCFNLPSITDAGSFANLRILHLENNVWENRTDLSSINFGTRTICTNGLTSFSPFALAEFAPTSASVTIGGRVLSPNGFGVSKAWVTLTEPDGTLRSTQTNAFGYYNFTDIRVGETYILSAFAKQYNFQPQIVVVKNDVSNLNITADKQ